MGLLKSFLGLSASLYPAVYVALLAPKVEDFLLLLALAPTALVRPGAALCCALCCWLLALREASSGCMELLECGARAMQMLLACVSHARHVL